ncbi:unnamed protein product [Caenorhabditis auriculariae]|uniref:Uncharacterized protein n=1 Tax=Caenorhabditis auriculariae TaxID=2777116 RepID=A0A8S1HVB5_9PELO|nr:unnamed protein product [Caenorhabditis auriculariae]
MGNDGSKQAAKQAELNQLKLKLEADLQHQANQLRAEKEAAERSLAEAARQERERADREREIRRENQAALERIEQRRSDAINAHQARLQALSENEKAMREKTLTANAEERQMMANLHSEQVRLSEESHRLEMQELDKEKERNSEEHSKRMVELERQKALINDQRREDENEHAARMERLRKEQQETVERLAREVQEAQDANNRAILDAANRTLALQTTQAFNLSQIVEAINGSTQTHFLKDDVSRLKQKWQKSESQWRSARNEIQKFAGGFTGRAVVQMELDELSTNLNDFGNTLAGVSALVGHNSVLKEEERNNLEEIIAKGISLYGEVDSAYSSLNGKFLMDAERNDLLRAVETMTNKINEISQALNKINVGNPGQRVQEAIAQGIERVANSRNAVGAAPSFPSIQQ